MSTTNQSVFRTIETKDFHEHRGGILNIVLARLAEATSCRSTVSNSERECLIDGQRWEVDIILRTVSDIATEGIVYLLWGE